MAEWRVKWISRLLNPVHNGVLAILNLMFSVFFVLMDDEHEWVVTHFMAIAVVSILVNIVFFIEMMAFFIVLGVKNVWKNKRVVFCELLIQISISLYMLIFQVRIYGFTKHGLYTTMAIVFLVRNVRTFHFLTELENMKVIT